MINGLELLKDKLQMEFGTEIEEAETPNDLFYSVRDVVGGNDVESLAMLIRSVQKHTLTINEFDVLKDVLSYGVNCYNEDDYHIELNEKLTIDYLMFDNKAIIEIIEIINKTERYVYDSFKIWLKDDTLKEYKEKSYYNYMIQASEHSKKDGDLWFRYLYKVIDDNGVKLTKDDIQKLSRCFDCRYTYSQSLN